MVIFANRCDTPAVVSISYPNACHNHCCATSVQQNGKTQLHVPQCTYSGISGKQKCECPRSLAAKTVDSITGKIRTIFRDIGRSGEWNSVLLAGNPAGSQLMKRHLHPILSEQAAADVVQKQDKLAKLCRYLAYQASVEKYRTTKFLYLRDRAHFAILCHSGDRGSDLGNLTIYDFLELLDSKGIFISEIAGKIASLSNPKDFMLMESKDEEIHLLNIMHLLKAYINFAVQSGIDLSKGYLFSQR